MMISKYPEVALRFLPLTGFPGGSGCLKETIEPFMPVQRDKKTHLFSSPVVKVFVFETCLSLDGGRGEHFTSSSSLSAESTAILFVEDDFEPALRPLPFLPLTGISGSSSCLKETSEPFNIYASANRHKDTLILFTGC
jgi:hypothetical protein